jgi:hypothetical protein
MARPRSCPPAQPPRVRVFAPARSSAAALRAASIVRRRHSLSSRLARGFHRVALRLRACQLCVTAAHSPAPTLQRRHDEGPGWMSVRRCPETRRTRPEVRHARRLRSQRTVSLCNRHCPCRGMDSPPPGCLPRLSNRAPAPRTGRHFHTRSHTRSDAKHQSHAPRHQLGHIEHENMNQKHLESPPRTSERCRALSTRRPSVRGLVAPLAPSTCGSGRAERASSRPMVQIAQGAL